MANTAEELSVVSNVSVHSLMLDKKGISYCSLKHEDFKNKDCSLTDLT